MNMTAEQEKKFDNALLGLMHLQEERRDRDAKKLREEWNCFLHFASQCSLLQKQAE